MNETGRLPAFAMLHLGMKVRLTQTVEDEIAVVDDTGTVIGIDFHEHELLQHKLALQQAVKSTILLRYPPTAVYVRIDKPDNDPNGFRFFEDKACDEHAVSGADPGNCTLCQSMRNVIAVSPYTNKRPWTLEIQTSGCLYVGLFGC